MHLHYLNARAAASDKCIHMLTSQHLREPPASPCSYFWPAPPTLATAARTTASGGRITAQTASAMTAALGVSMPRAASAQTARTAAPTGVSPSILRALRLLLVRRRNRQLHLHRHPLRHRPRLLHRWSFPSLHHHLGHHRVQSDRRRHLPARLLHRSRRQRLHRRLSLLLAHHHPRLHLRWCSRTLRPRLPRHQARLRHPRRPLLLHRHQDHRPRHLRPRLHRRWSSLSLRPRLQARRGPAHHPRPAPLLRPSRPRHSRRPPLRRHSLRHLHHLHPSSSRSHRRRPHLRLSTLAPTYPPTSPSPSPSRQAAATAVSASAPAVELYRSRTQTRRQPTRRATQSMWRRCVHRSFRSWRAAT